MQFIKCVSRHVIEEILRDGAAREDENPKQNEFAIIFKHRGKQASGGLSR